MSESGDLWPENEIPRLKKTPRIKDTFTRSTVEAWEGGQNIVTELIKRLRDPRGNHSTSHQEYRTAIQEKGGALDPSWGLCLVVVAAAVIEVYAAKIGREEWKRGVFRCVTFYRCYRHHRHQNTSPWLKMRLLWWADKERKKEGVTFSTDQSHRISIHKATKCPLTFMEIHS